MDQHERLECMIKELLREEIRTGHTEIPEERRERENMWRSLVNVREAKPAREEYLAVQDAYLQERLREKGVTDGEALKAVPSDERLVLWQGDMSLLQCDAVVNPANSRMLGCFQPLHACLDNVLHTFAGVQLRLACHKQMQAIRAKLGEGYEQPTAIPMMTDAFNLPAKKIVHVVGPVVGGALTDTHREQLAACYRNTMMLCDRQGVHSLAFCCISTGVFSFPQEAAADIAVRTVKDYLDGNTKIRRVIFNVFTDEDARIYRERLEA